MAGAMNKECFPFRPLLTEHLLLGTPWPKELSRHLDQCPDCTREAGETEDVVRTLQRVNPLADWARVPAPEIHARPSRELRERIRREMDGEKTARTTRGRRIALGLAAACVTATAVIIPLNTPDQESRAPEATSVVLVRQGKMIDRPYGTEVPVALSGLRAGETYHMVTVNADGTRISGGSVRAENGEQFSFRMVTAMDKDTITELMVEDEDGRVVTRVPVRPSPV
ncbi:hypothetical protein RJT17_35965 [Streptomyces sp. P5-A9]|uniref:hypothetical protein n=2 Tax=unclassified Streptomyces TaxID=2593676 RepID=UPI002FC6A070